MVPVEMTDGYLLGVIIGLVIFGTLGIASLIAKHQPPDDPKDGDE